MKKPTNFDEYKNDFLLEVQLLLEEVRFVIKKAAPQAEEVISYGMPAFKLEGLLVWYAAHSSHIGFYPKASGILALKKELSIYKNAKGSVQFPYDQSLPIELISEIVKFRLNENLANSLAKKKK